MYKTNDPNQTGCAYTYWPYGRHARTHDVRTKKYTHTQIEPQQTTVLPKYVSKDPFHVKQVSVVIAPDH